ncbi:complex I subunit 4 family protein [Methylomonas sp. MgM2]
MNDSFPLLTLCLIWPLFGAVLLLFCINPLQAKRLALLIAGFELCFTLAAVRRFDSAIADFQLLEVVPWVPSLNIHYQLGVDGISILFLPMTALVTLMALLASWNMIQQLSRFHLGLMLALESVTIGVFTSLDLMLFFLFWELTLPPIFFLIGLWGIGAERRYAAMKYTLYMLFGGVPLLFAIILLALDHAQFVGGGIPQDLAFSLPELLKHPAASETQGLVFLLMLLGFGVKAPLFPFHTWLPTVAMEAPAQLSALLTALKLGVYGIVRFAIPLSPSAAMEYRWLLAILGAITLIYGGFIALQQTNLRRLLAYSSVSHVGLVLIGIASFTLSGLQGAIMQLLNFAIVSGSLMLIAGMLQLRLGSNELVHLGGLAKPMPRMTVLFFLFALSSIGLPATNGFPAELLIFVGTVQAYPVLALIVLFAAVIGAAYMLGFVRRCWFGQITHEAVARVQDIRPREMILLALPAILVLVLGVYPQCLFNNQHASISAWVQRLNLPALRSLELAAIPTGD